MKIVSKILLNSFFVRTNKFAPIIVKLEVLKACVLTTLLYNCETFSGKIPKDLETYYFKMLKSAMGARSNTPNDLVLIESGMLPVKALILIRQYKFYNDLKTKLEQQNERSDVLKAHNHLFWPIF